MKLGPLYIGWRRLSESDRIALGLDPWPGGVEIFCIEWRDEGIVLAVRPRAAAKP